VAERGHEHPERGGVEQPVGRGPGHRPSEQGAIVHEDGEPPGEALDQAGDPIGVEEPEPAGFAPDDPARPLLTAREQQEEPAEGPEEDDPGRSGHHDQDRGRLGRVPAEPGRGVEPVGDQEPDECTPEHHVEDHRRADPLGPEGEAGVGPRDPRLGQEAVAEGGTRSRAAR
jgi:hypothetical protein